MSYVLCSGGLGNQMFQYAFYKSLVLNNKNAEFDTSYFKHINVHNGYELERCFGIVTPKCKKEHFNKVWQLVYSLMARMHKNSFMGVKTESFFKDFDLAQIGPKDILNGYWQSEKFFVQNKAEIVKDFDFKNISQKSAEIVNQMKNTESVAVHIRRGDYLGLARFVNLAETNYYKNATEYIKKNVENPVFYVFSDDAKWCRENMQFPGETVYVDFNKGKDSYQDMYIMSQAKYNILANSSFSWWAGYLGEHKFVIRPSKYKTTWSEEADRKLYPEEWIKMEV